MKEKKNRFTDRFINRKWIFSHLFFILGLLIVAIGILCEVYKLPEKFLNSQIRKTLLISSESPIYPDWINPSVPIYMKFYLFNVTNGKEIVDGNKPHLQELGPYVYRMYTPKFNVTFHSNSTVSYFNNHTLVFQPDMSNGSENNIVNHLNVPLASLGIMIKSMPSVLSYFGLLEQMVNVAGGHNLFTPHTAKEVIFGYKDPIFSMLSNILVYVGEEIDPFFGFFHKFNNSHDGCYLTYTGEHNYKNAHKISKWNGRQYLDKWSTKYANMINGSDGSFLGFNISPNDTPYVYFPQMFRSMKLEYEKETKVKEIKTLQFHISDDFLTNATIQPDNAGFCVPPGNCFDSGVLNVQSFMEGAPGIISLPHFYNAATNYQNSVSGLSPNKDRHDSIFHVEPLTGAVLFGERRLQINILVSPSDDFAQLNHVRKTIFPVMWMGGVAEIGETTANDFKFVMEIAKFMGLISYLIIATGCLILILLFFYLLRKYVINNAHGYLPGNIRKNDETTTDKDYSNEKETNL